MINLEFEKKKILKNILIINEKEIEESLIGFILNEFNIITLSSPLKAIELISIKKISPDLIFIDDENKELNGIDFLKELNQIMTIPTVIISSIHNINLKRDALANGAFDIIFKPYSISKLKLITQKFTC